MRPPERAARPAWTAAARPWTTVARGDERSTTIRCDGTTAVTWPTSTRRTRWRPVRTRSTSAARWSFSACTSSTTPRTPPVVANPTQFASQ
ncbi:MAG: hypothetical protein JOZ56_00695 [Actinobacteria bacterium]|nr:hypothetical protein [Actinomycetota bacterium]